MPKELEMETALESLANHTTRSENVPKGMDLNHMTTYMLVALASPGRSTDLDSGRTYTPHTAEALSCSPHAVCKAAFQTTYPTKALLFLCSLVQKASF